MRKRPFVELSNSLSKVIPCGFRIQELAINGFVEPDFEDGEKGSIHHEIAAEYAISLAERNRRTDKVKYDQLLYSKVKGLPWQTRFEIIELGRMFRDAFEIEQDADEHWIERRLYVSYPSFEPCKPTDKCDKIAGTPDRVVVYGNYEKGKCDDYKFGRGRRVQYDTAGKDPQMRLYAWLILTHEPRLKSLLMRLWTVLYGANADSTFDFNRNNFTGLDEDIRELYTGHFNQLDEHWEQYGMLPWPATGGDQCTWCGIVERCPKWLQALEQFLETGEVINATSCG